MSGIAPQLGTFTWLDGQGAPQKQCNGSQIVQNPGGGGFAGITVPSRADPYPAMLRGIFLAVPDFRSLIGTVVTYVKDGVVVDAYVDAADLRDGHWVQHQGDAQFMCVGSFRLVPLA
jgi:hypothetical protein